MSLLDEGLELLNLLLSVLDHSGTSQLVHVRVGALAEASSVGRTTDGLPLALVVLVGNLDLALDLSVDSVADVVFTVISVLNLSWDLLRILLNRFDADLELITTRGSVLFLLVTSLDDEGDLLVDSALLEETWTVAERLVSLGVQEEGKVDVGGRQVVACERELHNSYISFVREVRSQSSELSL